MDLLKEILRNEVYPALGCTEPVSCAYAAAVAAERLGRPVERLRLKIDRATFKNGSAVAVPHGGGAKGNLIAAAMGAIIACPADKLQLLRHTTPETLRRAQALMDGGNCHLECLADERDIRVHAAVAAGGHEASCTLAGGHANIERVELDGKVLQELPPGGKKHPLAYRQALKDTSLLSLLKLAEGMDDEVVAYLRSGVEMNLQLALQGYEVGGTAYQLRQMNKDGFLGDDLFFRTKLKVASAVDARMAGVPQAAMTSGGSGNQGIVSIITIHEIGAAMGVSEETVLKSIAVAHMLNAYVKCFTGELSVICGCAMASGLASAIAIVYQQGWIDLAKMALAANNVVGDLGGLICDGAKAGCALKAITSVDAAMRSALMAIKGCGVAAGDGIAGRTVEDTIRNLGRVISEGMGLVDPTMLAILQDHATRAGKA